MKCKLEIVTGFLGSGKTSFINSYTKTDCCKNEKLLVILLENGNEKINKNINAIYLREVDKLEELIIKKLKEESLNKIIIEVNGTIPLEQIGNVVKDKSFNKKINFYGNYFVGDFKNLNIYIKNMGELIIPLIQSSKIIILNNAEIIEEKRKNSLIKELQNINLTAPIVMSKNIEKLDSELLNNIYFKDGLIDRVVKYFSKGEVRNDY
jgi:G3E family GTPase